MGITVISPESVRESLESLGLDPAAGTPVADVARAYVAVVEGTAQGQVVRP